MLTLLLLLTPLVVLALFYGVALIVAVLRVKPEDLPQLMAQTNQMLRGLCERRLHRQQPVLGNRQGDEEAGL